LLNNKKFNALFEGDINIATLPDIFYKLQNILEDPDSSFEDIGDVILTDPGLTARLLKIANSPFYAPSSKIETISHALAILGLSEIKDIALSTLIVEKFKGMSNKIISMPLFWEHSLCCAYASKSFGSKIENFDTERIFIGGLLHNVGLLFLCLKIPEQMEKIVELCFKEKKFLVNAENAQLGFNHALVGERLLEIWRLPRVFQKIAKFHHEPQNATHFKLETSLVHLADFYTKSYCIGGTVDIFTQDLESETIKTIGLDRKQLDEIFKNNVIPDFKAASSSFLQAA